VEGLNRKKRVPIKKKDEFGITDPHPEATRPRGKKKRRKGGRKGFVAQSAERVHKKNPDSLKHHLWKGDALKKRTARR